LPDAIEPVRGRSTRFQRRNRLQHNSVLHGDEMTRVFALWLALCVPAYAGDKALILTDQEQAAARVIFDAAIRSNGLSQISRNAFILSDKLDAAGIVTERKDTSEKAPPELGKDNGQ
jgi:hypothetical protein